MKKYLNLLFVALFATMPFVITSCGGDEDEPQSEDGIQFTSLSYAKQTLGYDVQGNDVRVGVYQAFATLNNIIYYPQRYVLRVNGTDYPCTMMSESEDGDWVYLTASVRGLKTGYTDAELFSIYEIKGKEYTRKCNETFKIGMVSKEPDFALEWGPEALVPGHTSNQGGHLTGTPGQIISPQWNQFLWTVTINAPTDLIEPFDYKLRFTADTSNTEWVISDQKFNYDGTIYLKELPITFNNQQPQDMSVFITYRCQASIDGVDIDVIKKDPVTVKFLTKKI